MSTKTIAKNVKYLKENKFKTKITSENISYYILSILIFIILCLSTYHISILLKPLLGNVSPFISLLVCLSFIFYYAFFFDKQIKKRQKEIQENTINSMNIINTFDYSSLSIIKKVYYKDKHFYIILNNIDFLLPDTFILKMTSYEKMQVLDNILYKSIAKKQSNVLTNESYTFLINTSVNII